jgi:mannosyltransferase OCH1-like enzyme
MNIPHIIHQTYKDLESIPEHWKESHEEWKRLHPNSQYKFWSDLDIENFVKTEFPDFYSTFSKFEYHIQKVDAVRYMILYKYGGIYSDLDLIPNTNVFEKLGNGDLFLTHSANITDMFTNMFMASQKHHPFWLEVIEEMKNKEKFYHIGKHLKVMNTTGPSMLSRTASKTKQNITVVSRFLYNPSDINDVKSGKSRENKDSVLRVVEGGSWNSFDSKFYNFIYYYRGIFLGIFLTLFTISIFLTLRWVYLYFWIKRNCDCVCEKTQ